MELSQIDFKLQQQHLEKVSRTFALTIPMLPQDLVDYISNAYLLCRIADTIEDDPKTPTKLKVNWLYEFSRFASNVFSDDMTLLSLHKQSLELTKEGAKVEEYALLKDMILVINRTRNYPHRIKQIIARGVAIMSEGMARSLQGIKIEKLDDLDHYCYSVAGVVGELLSALFAEHNHKSDRNVLMTLSVSFGEGLQLCNILKDRLEDKKRDVVFIPESKEMSQEQNALEYIGICKGHLADAVDFICAIPSREKGIRQFCLLNVIMATATIKLIKSQDPLGLKQVKISRRKVKLLYVLTKLCASSNLLCWLLFRITAAGVKTIRRNAEELRHKVSRWNNVSA